MRFKNFLSSGFSFTPKESNLKAKYQLFNALLALNIFVVTIASILRLFHGENTQALFDFTYVLFALIIVFLARKYRQLFELLIKIIMTLSFVIVALTYINNTHSSIGLGWFFVQILISFFLSNKRFGFSMLLFSLITIVGTEYLTEGHNTLPHLNHVMLGVLPLVVFTLFITLFERRHRIQQNLLQKQNQLLETYSFDVENYDLITRLPNRKLFLERLKEKLKGLKSKQTQFAIIKMDLDDFTQINHTYGHQRGDRILLKFSKRLEALLWEFEALSKVGPDEFMVMVEYKKLDEIVILCEKILSDAARAFDGDKQKIFLTLSIGISLYPKDANTAESMLEDVDSALYEAKHAGKNCLKFYNTKQSQDLTNKLSLIAELKEAIEHKEFEVYYQPQIDATTQSLIGMEALVRWNRPDHKNISPAQFIPIAEEHGLIENIDFFVMSEAMITYQEWKEIYPDLGRLSLNLSMKLLENGSYFYALQRCMKNLNFNPTWLKLEITESHIMKDPEQSINMLSSIHALGIKIAIDDFGTGYSSLAYLQKLPIDKLKIDRTFIIDLSKSKNGSNLVKSIINLSQSLEIDVIAEGVETEEEKEFLIANGCKAIQGYFYSKPLTSKSMLDFIINNNALNKS